MTDQTMADQVREWATLAARAADAKTDADTIILSVGDLLAVTDLFVVTSGRTARQVKTLTDEIEAYVAEHGGPRPKRIEGLDDLRWVLMDYGDFVVHVFDDATREIYDLERLWRDAPRVAWATD